MGTEKVTIDTNTVSKEIDSRKEPAPEESLPWTEKYRPESLDEIIGQDDIVRPLKAYEKVDVTELPHMMFIGDPGLGKTTAARVFRKDLLKKQVEEGTDYGVENIRKIIVEKIGYRGPRYKYMRYSGEKSYNGAIVILNVADRTI